MNFQPSMFQDINQMNKISDITEFVVRNMSTLETNPKKPIFSGSVFENLRKGHQHQRGKVGEDIVIMLSDACGFTAERNHTYGDALINGIHTEVKTAFQGESGGFLINQIRPQDYKYLIAIVFTPKKVQIYTIPKEVIWVKARPQHGGNGAKETKMYQAKTIEQMNSDFYKYAGIDNFKRVYR